MASSICSLYFCLLTLGILHTVKTQTFKCYKGSVENYVSVPIDSPLKIIENIDKSKDIVIYVFGFKGKETDESTQTIVSAYIDRGDVNLILFDWSNKSNYYLTELEYPTIILKAREAGSDLGKAIVQLIENGISPKCIRLIGHSLGAHVCGWAGKKVQESNYNLSRITGLDPAGVLVSCPVGFDGLKSSHAQFVDVLHTNPGQMGTEESIGVVDFWANCGDPIQPCCKQGNKKKLFGLSDQKKGTACSHSFAWRLFGEAINSPHAFMAAKASSCDCWKEEDNNTIINYLGDHVNKSLPGNFYFSTNCKCPYAKGKKGLHPC